MLMCRPQTPRLVWVFRQRPVIGETHRCATRRRRSAVYKEQDAREFHLGRVRRRHRLASVPQRVRRVDVPYGHQILFRGEQEVPVEHFLQHLGLCPVKPNTNNYYKLLVVCRWSAV